MADHDDRERYDATEESVFLALEILRMILLDHLPLPISLPDYDPESANYVDTLLAVNRARALVWEEPISDRVKATTDRMILDWLTAYEMTAITALAGPAPWRLDSAEYALTRFYFVLHRSSRTSSTTTSRSTQPPRAASPGRHLSPPLIDQPRTAPVTTQHKKGPTHSPGNPGGDRASAPTS